MTVEEAVKILRKNNVDVVQTLEEYFVIKNGKLALISEDRIKKYARSVQNASNNVHCPSPKKVVGNARSSVQNSR